MSEFIDSLLGGFALGIVASNPYIRRMGFGCCGFGGGYQSLGIVDFGTFANPLPEVPGSNYVEKPSIFTGFGNPFPSVDFSGVFKSIWDTYADLDSDYNKQMRKWYEEMNKKRDNSSKEQPSMPQIQFPFSSFYMPTQFTMSPYNNGSSSWWWQQPSAVKSDSETKKATTEEEKKAVEETSPTEEKRAADISYDAKKLKDKWSKKAKGFPDEFFSKVIDISKKIKCDPDDLMAVMNLESTGFQLNAVNPKSGATGLIQFMPKTARGLGTTTEKLAKMSAMEQLDYVETYMIENKKSAGYADGYQLSAGELYAIVYRPAYARNDVVARRGEKAYRDNKTLDKNNDGIITKEDLSKSLDEFRV